MKMWNMENHFTFETISFSVEMSHTNVPISKDEKSGCGGDIGQRPKHFNYQHEFKLRLKKYEKYLQDPEY